VIATDEWPSWLAMAVPMIANGDADDDGHLLAAGRPVVLMHAIALSCLHGFPSRLLPVLA
jgi:hypothetical protein